jgi:hypothetical protein
MSFCRVVRTEISEYFSAMSGDFYQVLNIPENNIPFITCCDNLKSHIQNIDSDFGAVLTNDNSNSSSRLLISSVLYW